MRIFDCILKPWTDDLELDLDEPLEADQEFLQDPKPLEEVHPQQLGVKP
jgi:hypothetical protein